MTLGTFHAQVKAGLRRGTTLDGDAYIPSWTRRAARWLERNMTFQYMKRYVTTTVNPDAESPAYVSLSGFEFKELHRVRWVAPEGGRFNRLDRIEPEDRDTWEEGNSPGGYWLDGLSSMVLDVIPTEAIVIHLHGVFYTVWSSETSWDHWLLRSAEDALLARTLMNAAIQLQDAAMFKSYSDMLKDDLRTLQRAEEDLQFGGQIPRMEWEPTWGEFDSNFQRDE